MIKDETFKEWWLNGWIIFEFVALILGVISGGGGHGDYFFVKIFFPITMYTWYMQHKLGPLMIILAFIQYPVVGLVPFILAKRKRKYFYVLFLVINILFMVLVFKYPFGGDVY